MKKTISCDVGGKTAIVYEMEYEIDKQIKTELDLIDKNSKLCKKLYRKG